MSSDYRAVAGPFLAAGKTKTVLYVRTPQQSFPSAICNIKHGDITTNVESHIVKFGLPLGLLVSLS